MTRRILIVDANVAFATMLRQGLEEMKATRVNAVGSGRETLQAVAKTKYDMVIVDLDLPDVEGPRLVQALREEHPHMRLVIIPLDREEVPPELADIDIQGLLSKPFFLPELPDKIEEAFSRTLGAGPPPVEEEPVEEEPKEKQPPTAPTTPSDQIIREMSQLVMEVGAEAILLTEDEKLIAQAGQLPEEEISALAAVICESWRTSARVAQILGKEQLRFEQSIEGAEYLLYSLGIANALILSVVVAGRVPLGIIRHRAKETAETIRRLVVG